MSKAVAGVQDQTVRTMTDSHFFFHNFEIQVNRQLAAAELTQHTDSVLRELPVSIIATARRARRRHGADDRAEEEQTLHRERTLKKQRCPAMASTGM